MAYEAKRKLKRAAAAEADGRASKQQKKSGGPGDEAGAGQPALRAAGPAQPAAQPAAPPAAPPAAVGAQTPDATQASKLEAPSMPAARFVPPT